MSPWKKILKRRGAGIAGSAFLCAVAVSTLAHGGQLPVRQSKGVADEPGIEVALPARSRPVYTLEELARVLAKAQQREVYVDRRCKDRRLLIVQPAHSKPLNTIELHEAMSETTGLRWRVVDGVAFLTYHPGTVVQDFARNRTEEMRRHQRKIVERVYDLAPDKTPVSQSDLLAGTRKWDGMQPQQRQDLLGLLSQPLYGNTEEHGSVTRSGTESVATTRGTGWFHVPVRFPGESAKLHLGERGKYSPVIRQRLMP
jgi:hypothetical protein